MIFFEPKSALYQCFKTLICTVLCLLFLFLFFPQKAFALSMNLISTPSSIDVDQEVNIDFSMECSGCSDSYVRGVFFESGTNYFGLTKNNSGTWIGITDDKTNYFKISKEDFIDASWSGQIKVKVESSEQKLSGSKNYLFKIGRYTSANDSSADWSSEVSIFINAPSPTPTMTSTPTSTSTPSPTSTPTKTSTSTPKPNPTKTSTPKPSPSPEEDDDRSEKNINVDEIYVATVELTPSPEGFVAGVSTSKKFPFAAVGLIVSGLGFLGYGGYTFYLKSKNKYT